MRELRKSRQAEIDLEDIWLYSFKEWGIEQAHSYHDELITGIDVLRQQPEFGKYARHNGIDYRYFRVAKHMIYYRLVGDIILVVRVLHERMDVGRHIQ